MLERWGPGEHNFFLSHVPCTASRGDRDELQAGLQRALNGSMRIHCLWVRALRPEPGTAAVEMRFTAA
eukprot:SAG11_NODE_17898_length_506_cov_0.845209_1_plen_67_part_10